MNTRIYTHTEYLAVNAAWKRLEDYAMARGRMGEVREIREILADARREIGDQTAARGLLASKFIEALEEGRTHCLAGLWQSPRFTREIMAYAWHCNARDGMDDEEFRGAYTAMLTASDMHRAARRRLAAMDTPEEMQA